MKGPVIGLESSGQVREASVCHKNFIREPRKCMNLPRMHTVLLRRITEKKTI